MASLKVKELLCLLYSGLLFVSGLVLIGYSVFLSYKVFYHFKFIPSSTIGPFIVYFLLGFVHLFLTWLGIKGPSREHDLHIILFIILTVALLVSECALGIWSIILRDEVDIESLLLMQKSFDGLISKDFDKKDWQSLESKLKCCGVYGLSDYKAKDHFPHSCCKDCKNSTHPVFYETSCRNALGNYVKSILIDGVIMGFCCFMFQALGVFAFYVFFSALKRERQERIQRRLALQRSLSQENAGNNAATSPSAPHATSTA